MPVMPKERGREGQSNKQSSRVNFASLAHDYCPHGTAGILLVNGEPIRSHAAVHALDGRVAK